MKVKLIKIFTTIAILCSIAIAGAGLYMYRSIHIDLDKLIHYNPPITTQVYDTKGRLVAIVFDKENRIYASYSEFPSMLIETLVATEDTAFFEHQGVSFEAILRALAKDIMAGKAVEGASTLTQQLVKTMLLSSEKSITRKIKEAVISFKVEEKLTKQEILERYLNQIFLGRGYYGVKTAAWGYFRKNLNELTHKEAAMLMSLPKAPSFYDPVKNYAGCTERANAIIARMRYLGWIDDATFHAATNEQPKVYNDGLVYNKAPYAVETAINMLKPMFPDVKTGGYRIDLTLDLELQKAGDSALQNQYEETKNAYKSGLDTFNGAFIVTDQASGDILAMSGGVNYFKSPFNRAVQSKRQAGSSFKPFIYLSALDYGMTPNTILNDTARSYTFGGKEWKPMNYDLKFEGPITMRHALTKSKNLATIDIVERIGIDKVRDKLVDFGFTDMPKELAIALGTYSLSPYDMSEEYTLISNNGTKVSQRLIKSIRDRNGKITIYETKKTPLNDPEKVYQLIDIMKDVVTKGTGTKAQVPGVEIAGKTGTTNDYRDAWFCGFTPNVQAVVWFGNDNNQPLPKLTGGAVAAPVFAKIIAKYLELYPNSKLDFARPSNVFDENSTQFDDNNSKQDSADLGASLPLPSILKGSF